MADQVLLEAQGVSKSFRRGLNLPWPGLRSPNFRALTEVSFTLNAGQTLGVVGESGSGKSTLGLIAAALLRPSQGRVLFQGRDPRLLSGRELKRWRRRVQVIFQNPFSALNPRMTILRNMAEPLRIHRLSSRRGERSLVEEALASVGLGNSSDILERLPLQLSGGQLQRAALARSLILRPQLLIADEPVSMLDASHRADFLGQLQLLHRENALSLLYISHHLAEVAAVADRVLVLYRGRVMELGPAQGVLSQALHPYTRELLAALPRIVASGSGGDFHERKAREVIDRPAGPTGCPFSPACPRAEPRCGAAEPALKQAAGDHFVACWLA